MMPNLRLVQIRMLIPAALLALGPALTGATDIDIAAEPAVCLVNANDEPINLTEQKTPAPFNRRIRRNSRDFSPVEPSKVAYGSRIPASCAN
jgi:hypothetical protein